MMSWRQTSWELSCRGMDRAGAATEMSGVTAAKRKRTFSAPLNRVIGFHPTPLLFLQTHIMHTETMPRYAIRMHLQYSTFTPERAAYCARDRPTSSSSERPDLHRRLKGPEIRSFASTSRLLRPHQADQMSPLKGWGHIMQKVPEISTPWWHTSCWQSSRL